MTKFKKMASIFMALVIVLAAIPFASASTNNILTLGGSNPLTGSNEIEYEFSITQAGSYLLQTYSTIRTDSADTVMYVYDQNHNQIGMNDDTLTTDAALSTTFSTFQRYFEAGTYYVKVTEKNGGNLNCGLIFESLNDVESLTVNSNTIVTADSNGNYYKIFKFVVPSGKDFVLETSEEISRKDTILELYDINHNMIACNDDIDNINANNFSRINKYLTAGTYYVRVSIYRFANETLRCNLSLSDNSNYAYITSPHNQGYILQGEVRTFSINAAPGADTISLDYVINGTVKNISDVFYWDARGNCYKINADIVKDLFALPESSAFPKFRATLTYSDSSEAIGEIDGYITILTRSRYENLDPSWYYNDENDHSFLGFASSKYNCMAYALGVTDQWMWPWSVGYPDPYPVYLYFAKIGKSWAERPGYQYNTVSETPVAYPQVLFYNGGHVAVVTKWDEDGNPTELYSKCGSCELIKSNPQNGLSGYGEVVLWIKDRVEE